MWFTCTGQDKTTEATNDSEQQLAHRQLLSQAASKLQRQKQIHATRGLARLVASSTHFVLPAQPLMPCLCHAAYTTNAQIYKSLLYKKLHPLHHPQDSVLQIRR
jgi:hypothetical protein